MRDDAGQRGIEVRIEGDAAKARLIIPAATDPASVTAEALKSVACNEGVVVGPAVLAKLASIAEEFWRQNGAVNEVIAEAVPPKHGQDGRLEFVEGFDPAMPMPMPIIGPDDGADNIDFHNISSCITVSEGTHVATLRPPEAGENGHDVLGNTIAPTPGRASDVVIDVDTLATGEDGRVTARTSGVLQFKSNELKVSQVLDIKEFVDFSTGNIDFDGAVSIAEGIRDQFVVKASKDITVGGLIEAATVICGGNLACRRGMAAKDRGQLIVCGEARGVFFNNVRGWIKKSLYVARELMNCDFIVGGDLNCHRGTIIGGRTLVAGHAYVGTLGSRAGIPTTLVLGTVPRLNTKLKKLAVLAEKLRSRLEADRERLEAFQSVAQSLTEKQKEELHALREEIADLEQSLVTCRQKHSELKDELRRTRVVDLHVGNVIHRKVTIVVGGVETTIDKAIRGPLRMGWRPPTGLVLRQGDGPVRYLRDVA
ncbi:MAG: DUF342 domain-containing protein [Phycisphaerales bacterium]|nr:MAG: DUF342 domain-containing protein [Phycisphaerales bacterium]